jgi:hypothetical protein
LATRTWTATSGDWTDPANWDNGAYSLPPQAGDDVFLPSGSAAYTVTLSSATPVLGSLALGQYGGSKNAIVLQLNAGASLVTTGAISIAKYATIEGQGTLDAGGGFKIIYGGHGTPSILAGTATSGGLLDVAGALAYGVNVGFANAAYATTLKLEGANSLKSIAITSNTQTLELGASAQITFNSALNVTGGAIKLDGGTLIATGGVSLASGAELTGTGVLKGNISGTGSIISAAGGTLTLTQAVGNAKGTTSLVIGDGSSLLLTSTYGIGASATEAPTLTFQGAGDIFQATAESLYNIHIGKISGFAAGDYIKLASFGAGDQLTYNASAHTITLSSAGGYNSRTFTFDSSTNVGDIKLNQAIVGGQTIDVLTICFMPGTMIRTPEGEVPVETLARGDLVLTVDGDAKPVLWLGRQTIVSRFADPLRNWPIRVAAGALADNVPSRDLLLSPDHGLRVADILVHAGALVNDVSIRRETRVPERFVYYHVELEDHALILAENTPAETFIDNVERRHFDNWIEHEALYPDGRPMEELPYPRAKAHRQVPSAIRAELAERARSIGLSPAA